MNRGLARRSIFESKADVRKFLSLLTCAVRAGRVELHAFVFMLTHFHLLIRSVDGRISETMRLIQNGYVRCFNRARRRDGPLMRGRFLSFPVTTDVYARTAFRYIDQNPVDARIVARPHEYPYSSARFHRLERSPRKGLSGALVDGMIARHFTAETPRDVAYDALFAPRLRPEQIAWVESRLMGPARKPDELDDLLVATTAGVRAWARAKARLADNTKPGLPLVDASTVALVVADRSSRVGRWRLHARGYHVKDGWEVVRVALLRDLVGETYAAIARRLGRSPAHPRKLYQMHARCLSSDQDYEALLGDLMRSCLHRLHGTVE